MCSDDDDDDDDNGDNMDECHLNDDNNDATDSNVNSTSCAMKNTQAVRSGSDYLIQNLLDVGSRSESIDGPMQLDKDDDDDVSKGRHKMK